MRAIGHYRPRQPRGAGRATPAAPAALVLWLAAATTAPGAPQVAPLAYHASSRGEVTLSRPGGETLEAPRLSSFDPRGVTVTTGPRAFVTLVLSNGTGLHLGTGGSLRFVRFEQARFRPHDVSFRREPSASTLRIELERGTLVLARREPDAVSLARVVTPLGEVEIDGTALGVVAGPGGVDVYSIEGFASAHGGPPEGRGNLVSQRQRAVITPAPGRERNHVKVEPAPPAQTDPFRALTGRVRWSVDRVLFRAHRHLPGQLRAVPAFPVEDLDAAPARPYRTRKPGAE